MAYTRSKAHRVVPSRHKKSVDWGAFFAYCSTCRRSLADSTQGLVKGVARAAQFDLAREAWDGPNPSHR